MNRMMLASSLAFLLLAPPGTAAQEGGAAPSERVDRIFSEWDRDDSPGCAVGVFRDGETLHAAGYGMANLEEGTPLDEESVFYLASVTKQFTSGVVADIALRGDLSLHDPVARWFPELPPWAEEVTIRHMVHNLSGIRDYLDLMRLAGLDFADVYTADDLLELIAAQRDLNFRPGEQYLYSNSNFFLQALLVERATGESLREYAHRRFFEPLDMAATHFHDDHTDDFANRVLSYQPDGDDRASGEAGSDHLDYGHADAGDVVSGHVADLGPGETTDRGSANAADLGPGDPTERATDDFRLSYMFNTDWVGAGAGNLHTSIRDLARWERHLLEREAEGDRWMELTQTPGVTLAGDPVGYAFGIGTGHWSDLRTLGHGGSWMGFRNHYLRFPDQGLAVAVLCNLGTIDAGARAREVAAIYLEEEIHEALAVYEGLYRSEDVGGSEYRVLAEDGGLVLERLREGDRTRLVPESERGRFRGTWRYGDQTRSLDVVFDRTGVDAAGRDGAQVPALEVSTGRAWGVRFERVDGR